MSSSSSYFDHNQNLQIHGDVNFISNGEPSQDRSCFHVTKQAQVTKTQSLAADRGYKILCDNTAPSALYGYGHSFTGPQCHPGTRIAVQDYIFKWLDDPDGQIAMWMNGPVGIGKSAIAQTVAHLATEQGQLSSAFFFFRSDSARNTAKPLVSTLAYEMTQQIPLTRDTVCQTIAANPLIFSSPLDRQISDILWQSLRPRNQPSSEARRLIIIDGLDECLDTSTQQGIIRSFISSLLSASHYITPHKLLIVSRPESHIASAFSISDIRAHVKHLSLGSWDTEDDIDIFLRDNLKQVKDTHPMKHHLPDTWPDENSYRKLRERSVGSFAYATSLIRFLASHKQDPKRALHDIVSLRPRHVAAAFADLDALYLHILSSLDPDIRFMVQKVLYLHLYLGGSDAAAIAEGLLEEQAVVEIALLHVQSVVHFDGQCIRLYHTSFSDFLWAVERSGPYFILCPNIASAVAIALSNVWSHPAYCRNGYNWFPTLNALLLEYNEDWNKDLQIHFLRRLIATKIDADVFTLKRLKQTKAAEFIISIRLQALVSSSSTCRSLCNDAFDVICLWLRSQLNAVRATLADMLDAVRGNARPEILPFYDLSGLVHRIQEPIGLLCSLFPEMDCTEVCFGIVEYYLALPAKSRRLDIDGSCRDESLEEPDDIDAPYGPPGRLHELYGIALGFQDTVDPKLCQRLERLVLDGQKLLGALPAQYQTSKHCILHMLYGAAYYIDSAGQLYLNTDEDGIIWEVDSWEEFWEDLVDKTDNYIRQAHAQLEFPYICKDVEALYRLKPKVLKVSLGVLQITI